MGALDFLKTPLRGRLSKVPFSLFLFPLLITSCARDLKSDDDLRMAPKEFDQQIDDVSIEISHVLENDSSTKANPIINKAAASEVASKSPAPKLPSKSVNTTVNTALKTTDAKKTAPVVASKTPEPEAVSLSKHWPISVGEKVKMALRWGVIEAGVVSMEVMPPKNINGVPSLHYHGEVMSSKVLNLFYKIDNSIDTWVELSTLLPLRQEIKQLESSRWGRRVMIFDQKDSEVKLYEHMTKSTGEVKETRRVDKLKSGAQDLFGALYFYRFVQHMPKGFRYPIHDKGKNWNADLKFVGKETIRVPAGSFETVHYKVAPRLEGKLKPKGEIDIWLSDDDRQLLVEFNAKIKIGSVTGELIEYQEGSKIDLPLPVWKTPVNDLPAPSSSKESSKESWED